VYEAVEIASSADICEKQFCDPITTLTVLDPSTAGLFGLLAWKQQKFKITDDPEGSI
jgi:hypothetical protein